VYNGASSNNITMHWHGISQYGSPFADGTPYASQWPIPAGKYFDYEFQFDDDVDGTL
jgi:L-ascorbate oxidase